MKGLKRAPTQRGRDGGNEGRGAPQRDARSCLGSKSESKLISSTMDLYMMLLAVSTVSFAIVLAIGSFAAGYHIAKSRERESSQRAAHSSQQDWVGLPCVSSLQLIRWSQDSEDFELLLSLPLRRASGLFEGAHNLSFAV